ncbi:SDR family NAD(P)-dependent oxidoreductase [Microbacterium testaceum]|uniref:SDR family NAD(P)-dependent oxidoreductase n=1 Tax=Microbacterium testaceum TaxID=2033 RepID=UPI0012446599|nr:SDR family NAD(P)-dependent oxidoreductase [Microbacterium testaceum]
MPASTALITGGASGVGFATARRWLRDGGRVALLDLNEDALTRAAASLGPGTVFASANVASDDAVRDAVERAVGQLGGSLDVVVNCAGIARPAAAADVSDSDWSGLVDVHLNGTMRVSRAAYPWLAQSPQAAIVNVSSVAAQAGMPGRSSYCAAKAGIEGLTRALAVEWASQGIRVNAVAPGYINSEMTAGLIAKGSLDLSPIIARTPMARLAEPEEISGAIAFLASPDASYVTGQTLYVDGGMTVDGNWY